MEFGVIGLLLLKDHVLQQCLFVVRLKTRSRPTLYVDPEKLLYINKALKFKLFCYSVVVAL